MLSLREMNSECSMLTVKLTIPMVGRTCKCYMRTTATDNFVPYTA